MHDQYTGSIGNLEYILLFSDVVRLGIAIISNYFSFLICFKFKLFFMDRQAIPVQELGKLITTVLFNALYIKF